ncbi:MAG TPA: hypothetical protein VNA15_11415 [Candidatus Angelobacter sp.]|nr:hypothetical protein [Candidatus Angelobacter sp.]
MGKVWWLSRIVGRGGGWIFAAKLLLSFAAIVFAASISVTSSTYQAEIGSAVKVANGLIATDKGFAVQPGGSTVTSCSSPVTFGAVPGTANTQITGGHLVYDVQVNSTASVTPNMKFNATLVVGSTAYGPVCIQTPASPANQQTIDCKFDVGTTLPASPYTFKVTVQ